METRRKKRMKEEDVRRRRTSHEFNPRIKPGYKRLSPSNKDIYIVISKEESLYTEAHNILRS